MKNNYFGDIEDMPEGATISLVTDLNMDGAEEEIVTLDDTELPVLPLRNMVLFPNVIMPISVGRKSSLHLCKDANRINGYVCVVCQVQPQTEDPGYTDLHTVGTLARVVRIFSMPDESTTVILQGLNRCELKNITRTKPYLKGEVQLLKEIIPLPKDKEYKGVLESCRDTALRLMKSADSTGVDSSFAVRNMNPNATMVNFMCSNLPFKKDAKIDMLAESSLMKRAIRLLELLNKEVQFAELKASIQMRTREDIDQQQREYFLQQQIKTIQDELGSGQDQEIEELRQKGARMKWTNDVSIVFNKELDKLERTNPQSPDYNVQLNYLQTMVELPWNYYTEDSLNIVRAQKVLDKDHYGLEKVKERILEHLSVLQLKGDMKSPIICLYGPPGVGKTSLGRSIAAALKRKYIRMSLGGVHDESEIRGHRKTYIGAMPGRIIKGMMKAGSSNPVFILDEIDKVSTETVQGDPSSALLEVLDPEQNNAFHDNFLDIDYDLSKVMFIATANNLNAISAPLLDRMELIEVSGYIAEEKLEIARKHLVPKEMEANGIKKGDVKISKAALEVIIESYTRESGVRQLEKVIGKVFRKLARKYATDGYFWTGEVKPGDLRELLGMPEYTRDKYQGNEYAGVVTGLAWTAVGGEILFIETSLSKGKGGHLTLTGNLGDVMKESAMLALEYLKAHASQLEIDEEIFENWNIHLHVPEGAIPKDGPSAGITMATALASALTQRKVKKNLAMTGEITLRGKVLPVGGIKEKILAAKRAGITEIILCKENKKDIDEIQEIYLKGLTFHFVADVQEVLSIALLQEKVSQPIDFTIKKKIKE